MDNTKTKNMSNMHPTKKTGMKNSDAREG